MSTAALERVEAAVWARWAPPPRLKVSEWADRHRQLSPETSAEPGRWSTDRAPYLREPMDTLNDPAVQTAVLWKSAQVGGTEFLLNALLYSLACDPGSAMFLLPTLELAASFSKDRLAPAIRDCPALRDLIGTPRSRDADNAILRKGLAGAVVTIAGANSPASLSSRPVRFVLADELDRWPDSVGAEGDPLALAIKRTSAFRRRKVLLASTPTVKGASRIADWYGVSDQRVYETPCPSCGEWFTIEWQHVRWNEGDPATARLECPSCLAPIDDLARSDMIGKGRWRATAPFAGIAGFKVWEIVAPWRSTRDIVHSFLVAKRSVETLQVWRNTCVAELWEPPGESVEGGHLMLRRESYPADLPAGVKLLTAGIDTQDDRLELLVVGWGSGEECWIVSRETLPGDPEHADVWRALDDLLLRDWSHERGGTLRVECALVDSAGHKTSAVYTAIIPRQARRVFACTGRGERGFLVSPPKPTRPPSGAGTVLLRHVDSSQAKAVLFARLRVEAPGAEYVHFPASAGEAFFDELTAERLITKRSKWGVPVKEWQRTRDRNETLDTWVYAFGALRTICPTPQAFERLAAKVEAVRVALEAKAQAPPEERERLSREDIERRREALLRRATRSNYLSGGRR